MKNGKTPPSQAHEGQSLTLEEHAHQTYAQSGLVTTPN